MTANLAPDILKVLAYALLTWPPCQAVPPPPCLSTLREASYFPIYSPINSNMIHVSDFQDNWK